MTNISDASITITVELYTIYNIHVINTQHSFKAIADNFMLYYMMCNTYVNPPVLTPHMLTRHMLTPSVNPPVLTPQC